MKEEVALTVKPHWGYSIFHLGKDVENRSKALPKKYEDRRIWIHTSKAVSYDEIDSFFFFLKGIEVHPPSLTELTNFPYGAIVGSVQVSAMPYSLALKERWHMEDYNGWKISNAVLLPEPIPAKGKLGFWDCTNLVGKFR